MKREQTENNVVIKSQTSAAISGHQIRGEQLLVIDHAPDPSWDLPTSQRHQTVTRVYFLAFLNY